MSFACPRRATSSTVLWARGLDLPQGACLDLGATSDIVARCITVRNGREQGIAMKGLVQNIEGLAVKNNEFRRVLFTAKRRQLVVMGLKPKEEIGAEVDKLDQFYRVEERINEAVLDAVRTAIRSGFAVVVPAGTQHNIIDTGRGPLKLQRSFTIPVRTRRPTTNTSTEKRQNDGKGLTEEGG